ncbi:IclR family transcriptional regulator [Streptomyces sp. NPDC047043]|uniref:IclR family transcriptional regulator n=1 Tax=Streptomyces sp. NPDC047043 TaxID=3154497 RepID=UPI0033E47313
MKRGNSGAAGEFTTTPRAPQYPIESVDNALKVLLLLGEQPELRLTQVSEYLGVATSTAHRLLAMLQYRGFVRQNERTKLYGPGAALTAVGFSILQRFDFRTTLRPHLERLNAEVGETVHLCLLDGSTVRFVDALESPQAVRVASRLGRSMPASSTSVGKAMLAQLPVKELRALYPREELEGLTERSVRTRSVLEAELTTIRKLGYATSREESEAGVSSVAVAFPARSVPMHLGISVAAPIHRMTAAVQRSICTTLRATVEEAATLLYG